MAHYNVARALLLIAFIEYARALGIGQSLVERKTFIGEPAIAPELFHDSSFAFASIDFEDVDRNDLRQTASLNPTVNVTIVSKISSANAKCLIKLTPEVNATAVRLRSLRRASENKVLLTTTEELRDGQSKSMVIWVNLKGCTYNFAYADFLPETHFVIASHKLVSRNKFRLFVADTSFCKGSALCSFLLPFEGNNGLDSSNIELPWQGTRIESIESIEDLNVDFYAYHYRDKHDTYKMRLGPAQPPKYTIAELLSLKNTTYSEVVSSQLAVCWTVKASHDETVNCLKFNNYGRLMLNKTVNFREPITLIHVTSTKDGLLLFAGKKTNDLFVSKISENDKALEVTYRKSKLDCAAADVKKIVFDARELSDRSIRMEYVCDGETNLFFNDLTLTYN